MEMVFRAAVVCVLAALLALLLKKGTPETALALSVGGAAVVFLLLAGQMEELLDLLREMEEGTGLDRTLLTPLYKTIGIDLAAAEDFVAWCAKFAADNSMEITITISEDPEKASDGMKQYL